MKKFELTEKFVTDKVNYILDKIQDDETDASDYNWYAEILWADFDEDFVPEVSFEADLAKAAIKYKKLHPQMIKIVEEITDLNAPEDSVLINEEEPGGSAFAYELAMDNPANIVLMAKHFQSGDPDHSEISYYDKYFEDVIKKYGWSREIYPLVFARYFVDSQHRGEFFTVTDGKEFEKYAKNGDNLDIFFKDFSEWAKEFDYDEYMAEGIIYFISDAIGIDYNDDDAVESAVEKLMECLEKGEVPSKHKL